MLKRVSMTPLLLSCAWACSSKGSTTGQVRGSGETEAVASTGELYGSSVQGDDSAQQVPGPSTAASGGDRSSASTENSREASWSAPSWGSGETLGGEMLSGELASMPLSSDSTSGSSAAVDSNAPPGTWTPVESPRTGLSQCRAKSTVSDKQCEYDLQCNERLTSAHCTAAGEGLWDCSCYDDGTHRYLKYTVRGTDEETLCALGVENLCLVAPGPDQFECSVIEQTFGEQPVCRLVERCGTARELAPGVEAQVSADSILNECTFDGHVAECSCGAAPGLRLIYGIVEEQMCGLVDSFCQVTEPQEERHCADLTYTTLTATGCSLARRCGYRVELDQAPGAYGLYELSNFGSECQRTGSAIDCECFPGADPEWSLQFDGETELPEACRAVDTACAIRQPPVAVGAPLCEEITVVSQEPTSCVVYADCLQAAVLSGTPMTVRANLSAECEQTPDSRWLCHCYSGHDSRSSDFSMEEATASGACSDAHRYCQDLNPGLQLQPGSPPMFTFGDSVDAITAR